MQVSNKYMIYLRIIYPCLYQAHKSPTAGIKDNSLVAYGQSQSAGISGRLGLKDPRPQYNQSHTYFTSRNLLQSQEFPSQPYILPPVFFFCLVILPTTSQISPRRGYSQFLASLLGQWPFLFHSVYSPPIFRLPGSTVYPSHGYS